MSVCGRACVCLLFALGHIIYCRCYLIYIRPPGMGDIGSVTGVIFCSVREQTIGQFHAKVILTMKKKNWAHANRPVLKMFT